MKHGTYISRPYQQYRTTFQEPLPVGSSGREFHLPALTERADAPEPHDLLPEDGEL